MLRPKDKFEFARQRREKVHQPEQMDRVFILEHLEWLKGRQVWVLLMERDVRSRRHQLSLCAL